MLVLYLLEYLGEEVKSHGYIFTEPDAERIGINLYWMLVLDAGLLLHDLQHRSPTLHVTLQKDTSLRAASIVGVLS